MVSLFQQVIMHVFAWILFIDCCQVKTERIRAVAEGSVMETVKDLLKSRELNQWICNGNRLEFIASGLTCKANNHKFLCIKF